MIIRSATFLAYTCDSDDTNIDYHNDNVSAVISTSTTTQLMILVSFKY